MLRTSLLYLGFIRWAKSGLVLLIVSIAYNLGFCQSLKFENLKITKEKWLEQILISNEADTSENSDIWSLSNTGLFQDVLRRVEGDEIIYTIEEKKYWVPIVYAGLGSDREPIFTVGLAHYNLFGKGVQLTALYTYFERSSTEFFIDAPRFFKGKHGPYVYFKNKNTIEPIFFEEAPYDYKYSLLGVELGWYYQLTSRIRLQFGVERFQETYEANASGYPSELPVFLEPRKWTIKSAVEYNDLTYLFHKRDGWRATVWTNNTTSSIDFAMSDRFHKYVLDIRRYIMEGKKWNLAGRFVGGISKFDSTPFSAFVKDDLVNVRGIGERTSRGSSELTLNLEARRDAFIKKKFFSQVVAFVDYSNVLPSTFKENETLNFGDFNDFRIGLGLRLGTYYFYNSVLRIDFPFDPENGTFNGVLFGVGQYF